MQKVVVSLQKTLDTIVLEKDFFFMRQYKLYSRSLKLGVVLPSSQNSIQREALITLKNICTFPSTPGTLDVSSFNALAETASDYLLGTASAFLSGAMTYKNCVENIVFLADSFLNLCCSAEEPKLTPQTKFAKRDLTRVETLEDKLSVAVGIINTYQVYINENGIEIGSDDESDASSFVDEE